MPPLDRRVQVLFDPAVYSALEEEAAAQHRSVAAVIRESVEERLGRRRDDRRDALARLLARADAAPEQDPIDWEAEKSSFDREYLRDAP